ncbi:MAG TPA: pyruvate kinase [Thermodesulfovibrionales bacterium]|nr:pyruvate kinase [Thermodesulfovibrionales bacterium]
MKLPPHKTKIVCTIGPASESPAMMEEMIIAGMGVARLNFSHGVLEDHGRVIQNLRLAARRTGQRLAIMADLPGPKMRIGQLAREPITLKPGGSFTLTSEEIVGDSNRVSVTFSRLPQVVKAGNTLFLNDGLIQLEVVKVEGNNVICRVVVGGELRSRKGLNLPGIDLGISAFTDRDFQCIKFALEHGVDIISQSFVQSGADVSAVRRSATSLGYSPFIISKIERSIAFEHIEGILNETDGIMIARGDLGVEIPIEKIALAQKWLMRKANMAGKPVITATQMLESMIGNPRPTRAEATDVANAILDGTDCVMLSEESAMGRYPLEATSMLARIAATIEPYHPAHHVREALRRASGQEETIGVKDLIAHSVETAVERISPAAIFVPTHTGATARNVTRYRLPVWIIAVSSQENTCQCLQLSYGVYPQFEAVHPENWNSYVKDWMSAHELEGNMIVLIEGPSSRHPEANNRMEIIQLDRVV